MHYGQDENFVGSNDVNDRIGGRVTRGRILEVESRLRMNGRALQPDDLAHLGHDLITGNALDFPALDLGKAAIYLPPATLPPPPDQAR
jgi:hypothetical protein